MMANRFAGMRVREILAQKKVSVRNAPLPPGSPDWPNLEDWAWEDIEAAAKANRPGFKTIRKLLSDGRFDR